MHNLMEYLDHFGKYTLKEARFHEVDNLVFSQLAYVRLEDIVPETFEESITIREAAKRYAILNPLKEINRFPRLPKHTAKLLLKMGETARYGSMRLCGYQSRTDYEEEKQFAAVTIEMTDGQIFVAYRGTDDTIVGWKEDFKLAFTYVSAQEEAAAYLEQAAAGYPNAGLILGGHSKGGNLAVYAGVNAPKEIRDRIVHIYNDDGPGFRKDMIEKPEYQEMLERIHTFVPQSSVVGMLLEHEEEYTVVKSTQIGILQHFAFSWEIVGNGFVCLNRTTKGSGLIDETITSWLASIDAGTREEFVNALFSILEATDMKTTEELSHFKFKNMQKMIQSYNSMSAETKEMLQKVIQLFFNQGRKIISNQLFNSIDFLESE